MDSNPEQESCTTSIWIDHALKSEPDGLETFPGSIFCGGIEPGVTRVNIVLPPGWRLKQSSQQLDSGCYLAFEIVKDSSSSSGNSA